MTSEHVLWLENCKIKQRNTNRNKYNNLFQKIWSRPEGALGKARMLRRVLPTNRQSSNSYTTKEILVFALHKFKLYTSKALHKSSSYATKEILSFALHTSNSYTAKEILTFALHKSNKQRNTHICITQIQLIRNQRNTYICTTQIQLIHNQRNTNWCPILLGVGLHRLGLKSTVHCVLCAVYVSAQPNKLRPILKF